MTDENLTATRRIDASPRTVFALLADPAAHAAIDGTGWVRGPLQDGTRITAEGEVFDMAMYHPQHPDGDYEIANRVVAFEPPAAIVWEPRGLHVEDGQPRLRPLDLALRPRGGGRPDGRHPHLRLVEGHLRGADRFQFPPFPVEKLTESLDNLAKARLDLTASGRWVRWG